MGFRVIAERDVNVVTVSLVPTAVPSGVSAAAAPEAGDVSDEDLVRAEGMSVGASAGRVGHPFDVGGSHKVPSYIA
jgi:hypothetical protein